MGLQPVARAARAHQRRPQHALPRQALGVLLRSILVEREPRLSPGRVRARVLRRGVRPALGTEVGDDRIGRALDRLLDADRGALLTEIVVALSQGFDVKFDQFHSDTTSVRLTGQYAGAKGRSIRGKKAPWITYGYSKDHRPDPQAAASRAHDDARRRPAGAVPVRGRERDDSGRMRPRGMRCVGGPGDQTSSTWPTPSCAAARRWTTSTAAGGAS